MIPTSATLSSSDLRKFGLLMGAIVLGLFGWLIPTLLHHHHPKWPIILTTLLWIPALLYPNALIWVYKAWMGFGAVLGAINTRIILSLLYVLIICPVGLLQQSLKRTHIVKHYDPTLDSYRVTSKPFDKTHMERPF